VCEVDAVKVFNELDHVAALVTAAAMPDTLLRVDGEAVLTAALQARTDTLDAATQFYPAPIDLVLDQYGAGFIRPHVEGVGHDDARVRRRRRR
jgi:hypothetical protein